MNRACLVGRLTDDVELRKTTNGKDVVNFTVAINRIGEGADYISCVAWNKTAEFLSKYAKKGNRVSVDGHIRTRNYDDKNTGKKVYITEVEADYVDLIESKSKSNTEKDEYTKPSVPSFSKDEFEDFDF